MSSQGFEREGIERRRQGDHVGGDWRAVATSQGVPVALQKQPEKEGIDPPRSTRPSH